MKEYVGMVCAQIAQVLMSIVSKYAIADGMSYYSFIFYANAFASLVLLPLSLIFHRSANRPPLTSIVVCGFLIIGILGFFAQVFGYSGISLSSATLSTTILNLTPGFTFILAILCRMEAFDLSSSTQAKLIGTVVSITGAIIMTLYKGPSILSSLLKPEISQNLLAQPSNWVLGGIFLGITSVLASMCIIGQATVLNEYPAEATVMLACSLVYVILSVATSLIVGDDLSSYSLKPKRRLRYVLYSGIFGSAFPYTVHAWCVRRKGPLFIAMFHPISIVISTFIGVTFLGDGFYLGSLLGSVAVVIGFYSVMWGKAKDKIMVVKIGENSHLHNEEAPLLEDVEEKHVTSPSP